MDCGEPHAGLAAARNRLDHVARRPYSPAMFHANSPAASGRKPKPMQFVNLRAGDPAPWFVQRSSNSENFKFDTVGGRYVLMCFLVTAGNPRAKPVMEFLARNRARFDDEQLTFFGISNDAADEKRLVQHPPGIRYFWDFRRPCRQGLWRTSSDAGPGKVSARPL